MSLLISIFCMSIILGCAAILGICIVATGIDWCRHRCRAAHDYDKETPPKGYEPGRPWSPLDYEDSNHG